MSLQQIPAAFTDKRDAQYALTQTRKRSRVALRGAVVIGPTNGVYYVHANLSGTGFSAAELAAELRRNY